MTNEAVAQIIPFPARRPPASEATVPPPAPEGQARLALALASLNAALADQRAAMAAWQGALADLKQTTQSLSGGLQRYHNSLGDLGTKVASLREEAVKLESWADQVLDEQD